VEEGDDCLDDSICRHLSTFFAHTVVNIIVPSTSPLVHCYRDRPHCRASWTEGDVVTMDDDAVDERDVGGDGDVADTSKVARTLVIWSKCINDIKRRVKCDDGCTSVGQT
jgi:hypothetical protein